MSVIAIAIELLKEEGSYSPGDAIKGFVNLTVQEQVIISSVKASLFGICKLKSGSKHSGDKKINERKEVYVDEEKCLFTSKERNIQKLYTEAGKHVFPFTFKLPNNIPSSFESDDGFIRYGIFSTLEGFNTPSVHANTFISVNTALDLNGIPKSQFPATAVITRKKSRWLCLSETSLYVVVHTARRGYVPGEVITVNAEVKNMDSKPVISVKAHLMQTMKFHHKTKLKKNRRMVAEITRGSVLTNESQYWINENLQIPPVVSSYLKHSHLIDVKYKIYFCISKSGEPDIVLKLPIIIGTVPLMGTIEVLSKDSDQHSVATLDRACASFEPCFFGPHEVSESSETRNSREQCVFSPKYITFNV